MLLFIVYCFHRVLFFREILWQAHPNSSTSTMKISSVQEPGLYLLEDHQGINQKMVISAPRFPHPLYPKLEPLSLHQASIPVMVNLLLELMASTLLRQTRHYDFFLVEIYLMILLDESFLRTPTTSEVLLVLLLALPRRQLFIRAWTDSTRLCAHSWPHRPSHTECCTMTIQTLQPHHIDQRLTLGIYLEANSLPSTSFQPPLSITQNKRKNRHTTAQAPRNHLHNRMKPKKQMALQNKISLHSMKRTPKRARFMYF
eukprot:TRINITY_DN6813_c0_g1_i1.p1 TRINITY_DN6813_c0_g1~~TRINITY_DN6813_c0_g1_i1.p1  ORF type:complete len:257 (+),score=27.54 TRINITY_DN6813_c0_g1_i1:178-948(+)